MDGTVGIPQDGDSERGEISVACLVTVLVLRSGMLDTVDLDHELFGCDIEIDDIFPDGLLSVDGFRKRLQKLIPKFVFFRCHFISERLRDGCQVWIVFRMSRNDHLRDDGITTILPIFSPMSRYGGQKKRADPIFGVVHKKGIG